MRETLTLIGAAALALLAVRAWLHGLTRTLESWDRSLQRELRHFGARSGEGV